MCRLLKIRPGGDRFTERGGVPVTLEHPHDVVGADRAARPNRKYFGAKRGVTWLNMLNDQGSGLGGKVVSGTARDSLHMIDVAFSQDGGQRPEQRRVARGGAPNARLRSRSQRTIAVVAAWMVSTASRGIVGSTTSACRPTGIVRIASRRRCRARSRGRTPVSCASATSIFTRGLTPHASTSSSRAGSPRR